MDGSRPQGAPRSTVQGHEATPTRPTLLAATGPLLLSPVDWTIEAIAEAGYTAVEVLMGHAADSRDPRRVQEIARANGLDVPVMHGPFMVALRGILGTNYRRKAEAALEIAGAVGAETMVAHAPMRWERAARAWLASGDADRVAERHGTRFAMENLFPVFGRNLSSAITPDELRDYRHVVFDTSHFCVAGIDILDAWEALSDRVVHLHISDNYGNGKDSHAPLGEGVLPLKPLLRRVAASGYDGTLTLELDCRAHLTSRAQLVEFLTAERQKAEHLLDAGHADVEDPPAP